MRKTIADMVFGIMLEEHAVGSTSQPWVVWIVNTLLQIAVSPDEYTEQASVDAIRLIWEILGAREHEVQ